jgi:hypothetical protein
MAGSLQLLLDHAQPLLSGRARASDLHDSTIAAAFGINPPRREALQSRASGDRQYVCANHVLLRADELVLD